MLNREDSNFVEGGVEKLHNKLTINKRKQFNDYSAVTSGTIISGYY